MSIMSTKAVAALSVGFTSGLGLLVAQIAFGTFIFSGPLAPYSSQGVGLVLFGNFAACLIIALAGGYRGAISGLSPTLVVVMALIGTSIDAEGYTLFVTTTGALIISAVATGVLFLLIGRFRLSNLLRFIPYPMAAGFVAGIGAIVCFAAMSLMGAEPDYRAIPALLEPPVFWKWGPGALFGIALYLAMKRWKNPLILPLSVAFAVVAYHFVLNGLGISGAAAREAGLLFTSTADGSLWPALLPADIKYLDWGAMATQIPGMLTLILIAFIVLIMNLAGLELAASQDLDWDREFRATGFASVIAGLGGGTVGSMIVPASLRSKLFGATSRMTGVAAALVIGGALILGDGMLEVIPVALTGGILFFAGMGMLDQGLVRSHKQIPWSEFVIIVAIFFTIIAFGLLEGVGVGLVATLIFFVIRLSRVDTIESGFTLRERHSNRTRSIPELAILMHEGERVKAFRLCGYIFFGSVYTLVDHLKQCLNGSPAPACLMLDFTDVSGFDVSAVNVLGRFLQTANAAGVQVVLCSTSEQFLAGLKRNLPPSVFDGLQVEQSTDQALERCEELIIAAWRADDEMADKRRALLLETTGDDIERYLDRQIRFENLMENLQRWLNPRSYSAGDNIAGPDAKQEGLELLVFGRASVHDHSGTRLHQCVPGDPIWTSGALDGKAASVIADEPCQTMLLAPAALRWLEQHEDRLAIELYRYLLNHPGTGLSMSLRDISGSLPPA